MNPSGPGNPTGDLDDVVHQRHRLGILAIAAEADRARRMRAEVLAGEST